MIDRGRGLRPIATLTLTVFLLGASSLFAQSQVAYGKRAQWLIQRMEEYHVSPRKLDDAWSRALVDAFMDEVDANGYYLTIEDRDELLAQFGTTLDNQLSSGNDAFLEYASNLFERRVKWADSVSRQELAKPISFSQPMKHEMHWRKEHLPRCEKREQLQSRWSQYMRYVLLETLYYMHVDSTGYSDATIAAAMKDEASAREKLSKLVDRRLQAKLKDPRTYCGEALLRAMAQMYDPHSAYFSPIEEEQFAAALSTHAMSLGFELEENDRGETTIGKLVPGGPAWRTGAIHEGDVILSVNGTDGKEHDLTLADAEEIHSILDAAGDGAITLQLRKSSGLVTRVTLVKEEMRNDQNTVRSLVLSGERKVGYISLPGFYTDWEDENGVEGCANDVAKEILKLKKDGIEALIIDLRYNGGGSLKEAAGLAGLFIDAGPLWVARNNEDQRSSMKDPNRGVMWEGPLALMVNGRSASASEFIAGALQDYRRAIVVGSRTYGKATGQITLPLDVVRNSGDAGFLKVTTNKFYHLDGRSHQRFGVVPNVELEDPLETWLDRESEEAMALPADTIVKKTYYTPAPERQLAAIQEQSRLRIQQNARHKEYVQVVTAINQFQDQTPTVNLQPADFFRFLDRYRSLTGKWDDVKAKPIDGPLEVSNNSFDGALLKVDQYSYESQKALQADLSRDLYLRECVRILDAYLDQ